MDEINLTGVSEYLSQKQIADMLGVAQGTITRYRQHGRLPTPDARIGTIPGWHPATIESWLRNRPGRGNRSNHPKRQPPTAP